MGSRGSAGSEEPVKFEFLGLRCNHQVLKHLETKNLSNFGIFDEIWLFLGGFFLLASSSPHGRTRDLEILQVLLDLYTPLGKLGAY